MKLETFFEKFDQFADAPNAVAKMRRLILNLAVRGKLVAQNSEDEPAGQLLERIAEEKSATAQGRSRTIIIEPLAPENERYSLPSNWSWARTHDVTVYVQRGKSPKYTLERRVPVIAQKCVQWSGFHLEKAQFIEPATLATYGEERHVRHGDLLWNSTGHGSLGRILLFKESFRGDYPIIVADSHVTVIRSSKLVSPDYLFCWFGGPEVQDEINDKSIGSTNQTELPVGTVLAYDIPIPPLAEQKRIVAKVDELMALCDRLEAQQQERTSKHAALARASLARFADAPTPANLPFLFHPSFVIPPADLRKSILTLAVQGKLVPQDPNDESAEAIVRRVVAKRPEEPETPVDASELPWSLPSCWQWVCLGTITNIKHGYAFSSESFTSEPTQYVLTTPGNFYESGGFRDRGANTKYYKGEIPPAFVFNARDLIIPMTEQAAGLLGSPAFIPDDGKTYLHNQRLGKMEFYSDEVLPEFVSCFFNSEFFRGELARTCTGMKVRHTSPKRILKVPFPLPPLAEQRRIVAKVEQLMALVDALETQLAASRTTATNLLSALVAELTCTPQNGNASPSSGPTTGRRGRPRKG